MKVCLKTCCPIEEQVEVLARQMPLKRLAVGVIGLTLALMVHTWLWWWLVRHGWVTAEEHGGMENAQAAAALVGMVLFGLATARRRPGEERLLYGSLSLLNLTMMLRELEVQQFDLPGPIVRAGSGAGRNWILGVCWCVLLLIVTVRWQAFLPTMLRWARTPVGWLVAVAGLFLIVSQVFDANWFHEPKNAARFKEEAMESNGFLLMVVAAAACLRTQRNPPPPAARATNGHEAAPELVSGAGRAGAAFFLLIPIGSPC